jgi:hypothetical protein
MSPSADHATEVAVFLQTVLDEPPVPWADAVARVAALLTQHLADDPAAPATIARGLRHAVDAALTERGQATERLTAVLALFTAAMARVEQTLAAGADADTQGFGRLTG